MFSITPTGTVAELLAGFRANDHALLRLIAALAEADIEAATGLSSEIALQLEARMTRTEARTVMLAAQTLRQMPKVREASLRGMLCWGQLRAICLGAKLLRADGRAQLDERLGALIPKYTTHAPEDLLEVLDRLVEDLRPGITQAKEERAIRGEFLYLQRRLEGGAALYGEFGAESAAIIAGRLDAEADRPVAQHDPDDLTRPQQYGRALVEIMAQDGDSSGRSRPRLLVTVDLDQLAVTADAKLFWPLPGRAPVISHVSTDTLACDATITPVFTHGGRPIHVGDAYATITAKQRDALITRDRGCRGPGYEAPVQWTDCHHFQPRAEGGPTTLDNMGLFCRPCHRRAHRYGWKMRLLPDGTLVITIRGKKHVSYPRGAPLRE